jgi:hypothetical protein
MPRSKSYCGGVFLSVSVALAGILLSAAPARAGMAVGVLVPAYFYPGTGGTDGFTDGWAQMAASAGKVPLTAIFNPNSGPGPSTDPNYVAAITNLEKAGGRVVAYVPTNFGATSLGTVEGYIQTYLSQYPGLINGFFIDQMFLQSVNPPSTLPYYQNIYNYVKSQGASYTVIGNPGSPFLNGVSPQDFLSTADVLTIFEGPNKAPSPGAAGFDAYPYGLNWFQSFPSNRFSNIVFDVLADAGSPGTSSAMLADLGKAIQFNAGSVYITDQNLPNPYAQLPSYWNQEVSAIQAADAVAVPEPGLVAKLASGTLCWFLVLVARGLVRQRRLARSAV